VNDTVRGGHYSPRMEISSTRTQQYLRPFLHYQSTQEQEKRQKVAVDVCAQSNTLLYSA
jgi:hypothetical protein